MKERRLSFCPIVVENRSGLAVGNTGENDAVCTTEVSFNGVVTHDGFLATCVDVSNPTFVLAVHNLAEAEAFVRALSRAVAAYKGEE